MDLPQIASPQEWLDARLRLLDQEKQLTRQRDEVAAQRRRLPMVEISKDYRFTGPEGEVPLAGLFEGRDQLIVYHFMFDPDWDAGCPSCSFLVDGIGNLSHLHARRTSFVAVSRAPIEKLLAYRERMRWTFPWYSSSGSDFNYDFHVTIDAAIAPVSYNYQDAAQLEAVNPGWTEWSGELPGTSAFLQSGGRIFHTYSSFARGGDQLIGTYQLLDLTALGRQEDWEQPPGRSDTGFMEWMHRHDEYDPKTLASGPPD